MSLILKGGSGTTSIEGQTDGAKIDATGALTIPVGTTAQRPGTPVKGMLRLNTDINDNVEVYNGTAFVTVGLQNNDFLVDFLVVAGGGGGGGGSGGGGGGGGGFQGAAPSERAGGSGGSGVVIIKYPDSRTISNPGGGLTLSTSTAGGFSVTTVTAGTGNVSFA